LPQVTIQKHLEQFSKQSLNSKQSLTTVVTCQVFKNERSNLDKISLKKVKTSKMKKTPNGQTILFIATSFKKANWQPCHFLSLAGKREGAGML